jgi:hypothetical protein
LQACILAICFRPGSARLDSTRLHSARLGSTRLDSARLGSARLGSAQFDSTRLLHGWLAGLIFEPKDGDITTLVKPYRIDGVTPQKTVLFAVSTVRISEPTKRAAHTYVMRIRCDLQTISFLRDLKYRFQSAVAVCIQRNRAPKAAKHCLILSAQLPHRLAIKMHYAVKQMPVCLSVCLSSCIIKSTYFSFHELLSFVWNGNAQEPSNQGTSVCDHV